MTARRPLRPAETVVLHHAMDDDAGTNQQPILTWSAVHFEGVRVALVRCDDQACLGHLVGPESVTGHKIDAQGKVTPSIGCSDCGWHVFATLEDWQP